MASLMRWIPILGFVYWSLVLWSLLPPRMPLQMVREARDAQWDYRRLRRILLISLVINLLVIPLFVSDMYLYEGVWLSVLLYLAVAVRLALARWRREKGCGWLFYAVLIWMSPFWIPLVLHCRTFW